VTFIGGVCVAEGSGDPPQEHFRIPYREEAGILSWVIGRYLESPPVDISGRGGGFIQIIWNDPFLSFLALFPFCNPPRLSPLSTKLKTNLVVAYSVLDRQSFFSHRRKNLVPPIIIFVLLLLLLYFHCFLLDRS